jgi:hypothetical protein
MWVHGLEACLRPVFFKFSGKSILMPLHRGAPRAPTVRWALRCLERKRLMAEILRGMQLMHMYLMLDAFNPILATAVLEAKDLPPFVMCSLLFPCVGKLQIAGIVQAVSRALQCYFQRRKLGSANSGGCLSCGRKRKPPPTLHDWSDDMCSEAGSSGEASDMLIKSDSERSQASTKRVSGGKGVQAPRRKTATHKTSEDMDHMALKFHAQMDRSFDMYANFLKEWAGHQRKVLELQEKQAQAQVEESKNLQALLNMGHLSPNTKQKLVKSIANKMCENM